MLPTNNGKNLPCTPISSNCVIWQGPDIECINLCNGDTVSDVVGKLATELCALIDATCECNPDLTGLNPNCIPGIDASTPLVDVLNAIITQACESSTGTTNNLNVSERRVAADGNLLLPECLYYNDEFGNPVTELPINEFVVYLANEICGIQNSIVLINGAIENFETRIGILENCVLPCKPQKDVITEVVSSCLFPGDTVLVSTLLLAIEKDYCTFKTSVGTPQDIYNSIALQGIFGTTERLSGPGTFGSLSAWVNAPANLSQSHKDQWIVLNDLYSALKDIQDNFIDTGCSGLTNGFTYNIISDGSGVPVTLNLNFTSTSWPASYSDCGGSTNVKIIDSLGNEINQGVNIASLQNEPTGANINLSTLNVNNSITVQVDFCGTDGTNQCQEKQSIIIPLETLCPTNIAASAITESEVTVTFTNVLGTGVSYKIDIVDASTSAIAGTTTLNSPGFTITETFSSLASGTNYNIVVTITSNGVPKVCTPVAFQTSGIICNNEIVTLTGTAGSNDIYLGYTFSGAIETEYYYNPDSKSIVVGTPAVPTCYAPIFSNYSINELTGDVTYDLAYGTSPGLSVTIDYSIDGISYLLPNSVTPGAGLVYSTGVTSGVLYIRLITNCASTTSQYVIIRYDFITDQWQFIQSPSDCQYDSISSACPAGVQVAQQFLECEGTNYNVFTGGVDSYWFFIKQYVRAGVTIYIYAGWTQASGVTTIVECCSCPAFLLTDSIRLFCQEGNSVSFSLPYVLGNGIPTINVSQPTTNGTLTQASTGSNQFTYTHISSSNSYADTFTAEIIPQVIGDCESLTATIQIQIIPDKVKLNYQNQAVFAFIDTNSYTPAEGADIKAGLLIVTTQWFIDWGFTGTLYFIPTTSKRWLGYQKAIVDDGVSANLSADPAWTALQVLPTSWTGGAPIYKNSVFILSFSNDSNAEYHDASLASGFGSGLTAQPRTEYQEDFDALYDAVNGTNTSTWATGLGIVNPQYPDGFSAVYYPLTVQFSATADAASILQSTAAYVGEMIPPNEYGIQTAVDITGYLLQGLVPSATNPYQGALTTGGNILVPLYDYGYVMYVDNLLKTNTITDIAAGNDEQFINQISLAAQDSTGSYPASPTGTLLIKVIKCDTGLTELIEYTGGAPYPVVNTTYEVAAIDNSTGLVQYFHVIGYGLGVASFTYSNVGGVVAGCEVSSTQFRVQDCTSGYFYDVEFGVTGAVIPGNVYKLTNTGPDFLPGGSDDWLTGQDRCITVISQQVVGLDISSITVVSTHADCTTCTP
jgi:hypothetical protein